MRYMGIDYGGANVGLAVGEDHNAMAFPYLVLPNKGKIAKRIADLVHGGGIDMVVLGRSVDESGQENPIMNEIKKFKHKLEERGIEVVYEDEGGTTVGAEGNDSSSAALILQSYLEGSTQPKS